MTGDDSTDEPEKKLAELTPVVEESLNAAVQSVFIEMNACLDAGLLVSTIVQMVLLITRGGDFVVVDESS